MAATDLSHNVMEELYNLDPAMRVFVVEFTERYSREIVLTFGANLLLYLKYSQIIELTIQGMFNTETLILTPELITAEVSCYLQIIIKVYHPVSIVNWWRHILL